MWHMQCAFGNLQERIEIDGQRDGGCGGVFCRQANIQQVADVVSEIKPLKRQQMCLVCSLCLTLIWGAIGGG